MKKKLHIFLLLIAISFFTSCSVSKQITGEFYLDTKKYDKGYKHFLKEVNENKDDAYSQYYYARFLLAKKQNKQALVHFKKAVELNDKNANYYSWLAVAYSTQKDYKKERIAYLNALKIDKKHIQSLLYLAHNYYDKKEYLNALKYYTKVLKISETNQISLFNRAMLLNKLNRTGEEKQAWLIYLDYYPSEILSKEAVIKLNNLGNFDYRNNKIGIFNIILKSISFEPFTNKIKSDSKTSLDLLAKILNKNKKIKIHIVSYQKNNKQLAKAKAQSIKKYILKKYPSINSSRLLLTWFDKSKKIKLRKKRYILNESIDFITVINQKRR
jgi:tetratricopeptide (TPR) repeat protein